jgi:hypothetical protein
MTRRLSPLSRIVLAVTVAAQVAGCVYYNGMYNANRLANSARKAEREGRTFEANNLWGQVATKAESLVVRHPRSKYAEEAAILRGLALARLGQCEGALSTLSRIAVARLNSDLEEDAWLASGRCHMTLGNLAAADAAFTEVLNSKNAGRRREARFHRAQTLRHSGRYEEALVVLDGNKEPRAQPELLLSLAGAGRLTEAMALADSLVALGDTTQPWDSLLVTLGRQNPASASRLTDRLSRLPGRGAPRQAQWLLQDGIRLMQHDTARAAARFREAVKVGGSGEAAARASLQLMRMDLRRVNRPEDLTPRIQTLRSLASQNGVTAAELTQLGLTAATVQAAGSTAIGTPQGDLRLFLAAEVARDSLLAPRLAEGLFLRIVNEWPESPYAPKAVLAAQQLNPEWTDSARTLLETRYYASPYLAVIRGEEGWAYRQLEDSLGAFASANSAPVRRATPITPGRTPAATPNDDEQPGRRRAQPAPSVRVVEP